MQTTIALFALLGLVAAQTVPDLSQLPQCAQTCTLQGIGASGCDVTDLACICGSQSYLDSVQACITAPGACNEQEVQQAQAFAAQSCPDLNTNSTSSSTSASGSATGSASSAASSATGSASSAISSASESAASATSSVASSASAGASSAASAASSGASAATSGSFAAPTMVGMGVAQLLGVVAVAGAAL